MPKAARIAIAVLVLLCAALAGFYATIALAPDRLHSQVESWLTKATHAPAKVATLRLVLGFPVRLDGTGLRLYDGALTVEHASARIDVVSLLIGRPRLTRLRLDGAHLSVDRTPEGKWEPPIFGPLRQGEDPEPAVAPLRVIEGATRSMLTHPLLADSLIVRRSRVSLVHPSPADGGEPVRVVFQEVNGRLLHSRLFGDARLFLRVRVESEGQERGRLEWNGTRDEDGVMKATMAATGLDLASLVPYVRGARPQAKLAGSLDGIADFETAESGVGRLDLDLVVHRLETSLAHDADTAEPLRVPELALRMGVDLDHERVVLSKARIGTGAFDFALDAEIARPLRDASSARMTVSLGELVMKPATARKLASWLPASGRRSMTSVAERIRSGRLVRAELRGVAPIAGWRRVITGSLERLPAGFHFGLQFDDVAMDVDDANRLEDLEASLEYVDDTLVVSDAAGILNGGPLPGLSVSFTGLSKVLAAPPEGRGMTSSAEALVGLTPLFEFLRREPDPLAPRRDPPTIELAFDHLHHPALLWPLHDVRVQLVLQPDSDGVVMQVERAAWAGVLLDGEVDWTLHPERKLDIRLLASVPPEDTRRPGAIDAPPRPAPEPGSKPEGLDRPWVEGRFTVGAMDSPGWSQSGAAGRFLAAGGKLRLEDVDIQLTPAGRLSGWVDLDVSQRDRVPYQADLNLAGADVRTIIQQRGASGDLATGTLDVTAHLEGSLVPGRPLLHDAYGHATMHARKGAIQRSVPPVLALALASTSLNPFSGREALRYGHAASDFSFENGKLSTTAFEIEGPDIRLFASGGLDLSRSPHPVDAEVVLFLFRQVDRALELIPILNVLLLGENENLIAAYYQLEGPWEKPVARSKPLRTLEEGPGSVLTKGSPRVMMRGMRAIGGLFQGREETSGSPDDGPVDNAPPAADPVEPPPS